MYWSKYTKQNIHNTILIINPTDNIYAISVAADIIDIGSKY